MNLSFKASFNTKHPCGETVESLYHTVQDWVNSLRGILLA